VAVPVAAQPGLISAPRSPLTTARPSCASCPLVVGEQPLLRSALLVAR